MELTHHFLCPVFTCQITHSQYFALIMLKFLPPSISSRVLVSPSGCEVFGSEGCEVSCAVAANLVAGAVEAVAEARPEGGRVKYTY